jgi:hypothetical protein
MSTYLYLSIVPEALIASMLEPEAFGRYLSTGNRRMSSGPAIFFELDPQLALPAFGLDNLEERCRPHESGDPRRSAYLAIYRVLERVPVEAVRKLYITTRKGLTLGLDARESVASDNKQSYYLYQELSPVTPRVVSRLAPSEFVRFMTSRENPVSLPKLLLADMRLGHLANDPEKGNAGNLPYQNLPHLRECMNSLLERPGKASKVVNRELILSDLFTNLASGFYLGAEGAVIAFPMPDRETLSSKHNLWWMSAQSQSGL